MTCFRSGLALLNTAFFWQSFAPPENIDSRLSFYIKRRPSALEDWGVKDPRPMNVGLGGWDEAAMIPRAAGR